MSSQELKRRKASLQSSPITSTNSAAENSHHRSIHTDSQKSDTYVQNDTYNSFTIKYDAVDDRERRAERRRERRRRKRKRHSRRRCRSKRRRKRKRQFDLNARNSNATNVNLSPGAMNSSSVSGRSTDMLADAPLSEQSSQHISYTSPLTSNRDEVKDRIIQAGDKREGRRANRNHKQRYRKHRKRERRRKNRKRRRRLRERRLLVRGMRCSLNIFKGIGYLRVLFFIYY